MIARISKSLSFVVCLAQLFCIAAVSAAEKAEHVVLVVWDGMRPDFVSPQYTPTLYELAQKGTFFANHHPVYVSSTEVNGTYATGGIVPRIPR